MVSLLEQKKITPNEKQFECIKTLDGPIMVLAGPGTGKTFTIEKHGDGLAVIDFKTGPTKSRKSIEDEVGKHSDYMDQLRFYKLLYEFKYQTQKVHKGLLIFVEEPQTHEFILTEDDKELITDKIITTFDKIHKLEFDACDMRKQEAKGCRFCN